MYSSVFRAEETWKVSQVHLEKHYFSVTHSTNSINSYDVIWLFFFVSTTTTTTTTSVHSFLGMVKDTIILVHLLPFFQSHSLTHAHAHEHIIFCRRLFPAVVRRWLFPFCYLVHSQLILPKQFSTWHSIHLEVEIPSENSSSNKAKIPTEMKTMRVIIIIYFFVSFCGMPCFIRLRCIVLCCSVLRCAVLCTPVIGFHLIHFALLCSAPFRSISFHFISIFLYARIRIP